MTSAKIFSTVIILALSAVIAQPRHSSAQTATTPGRILRVIQDPGAHSVWLLRADPLHPAGPGTLVEVKATAANAQTAEQLSISETTSQMPLATPLIRSGDRVCIEQHSPHLDSWLSAVALEPAYANAGFRLRLAGGQILRAIAIDAHKARLIAQLTPPDIRSAQP